MWAIFGGILGGTILLGASVAITKEPTFWYPTTALGCGLAVILSWLGTTTLTLKDDAIGYRSLFVRRDIPLINIARVEFTTEFYPFKPYQRVCIVLRDKPSRESIIIGAGLFDRAQIAQWVRVVNTRLQQST